MTFTVILALSLIILVLWRPGFNFRAQKLTDYQDTNPTFDIRTHLSGDMVSEGVIYGPTGRVVSRFVAQMKGTWQGTSGVLSEDFIYEDGTQQHREWRLNLADDSRFTALADDIIGEATGAQIGSASRLTYRIRIPDASGGHELDVVDWMYLMENGTIINRSEMRKFGIKVVELVATIRPDKPKDTL